MKRKTNEHEYNKLIPCSFMSMWKTIEVDYLVWSSIVILPLTVESSLQVIESTIQRRILTSGLGGWGSPLGLGGLVPVVKGI